MDPIYIYTFSGERIPGPENVTNHQAKNFHKNAPDKFGNCWRWGGIVEGEVGHQQSLHSAVPCREVDRYKCQQMSTYV